MYGFYMGQCFDAHEFLGAHVDGNKVIFRTFAPSAAGITVLHDGKEYPMAKIHDGNFYETAVEGLQEGDTYEYRIYKNDGSFTDHCDPYGFGMEFRPEHKSIIRNIGKYSFGDGTWMKGRGTGWGKPLNIYELHAGSFRKPGEKGDDWYRYDELAERLIPYLKESGYNYVEFLPLSEHPCDESWGYQNTGFFAPTSRYGEAKHLMRLIDLLHQNGIGAILDFVPVHFAVDEYALVNFDGTALYEYPHQDVGISEWGSYNFMHSRGEVRSFLQSAANYWLGKFHFDGLRMDAISRIIYWQGDERRGVNGNAVEFLKTMNKGLKERNGDCILIAEDSTNFGGVTKAADQGGLGFDYKWDMGWMHDTLSYFQMSPEQRKENYHKLTFSMMYYYNEQYLLPLSHDEVVHGKATILQKMNGDYEVKFPQARAMYLYMMMHPGKKMNFMGNEIGQLREWDEKREQDWELRKYPMHDSFYLFMNELNQLYTANSALWAKDYTNDGFWWVDCKQEEKCIYAFVRSDGEKKMLAVFNFSDKRQEAYEACVVENNAGRHFELAMNSDWQKYSGVTPETAEILTADENGKIRIDLAPFSGKIYFCRE